MFDQLIVSGKKNSGAASKAASKPQIKAAPKAPAKAGKKVRAASPDAKAPRAVIGVKFALSILARPQRGNALQAHTQAFLDLSGMIDGGAIPRAQAVSIIGATAVNYHTGNGNFEQSEHGLKLSEQGLIFFMTRSVDPELFAAYKEVMTTGQPNAKANVKAANGVVKL